MLKSEQSYKEKHLKALLCSRRRCRQLQQRLSGKERRFQKHINHEITTYLVKKAATNKNSIAIEDLTNIRQRTNQQPRSKKERRLSNSWAFYQFRMFLAYKCVLHGVKLILVNRCIYKPYLPQMFAYSSDKR
ncbi:IS200/IS605 family accessory protein TnpB-related protein [Okeania sp. SIO2C9]|uniref:IS200/IS605 family accessory protein TnpB-related protein n=1 Tax=Okeania sp. SIO2C9 TaxID=2607791 RepID=UPI00345DABE9